MKNPGQYFLNITNDADNPVIFSLQLHTPMATVRLVPEEVTIMEDLRQRCCPPTATGQFCSRVGFDAGRGWACVAAVRVVAHAFAPTLQHHLPRVHPLPQSKPNLHRSYHLSPVQHVHPRPTCAACRLSTAGPTVACASSSWRVRVSTAVTRACPLASLGCSSCTLWTWRTTRLVAALRLWLRSLPRWAQFSGLFGGYRCQQQSRRWCPCFTAPNRCQRPLAPSSLNPNHPHTAARHAPPLHALHQPHWSL